MKIMITVCMATYNGELFIKQQIDSILCQIEESDELIISDDGSTDKTLEIIKSYNDKRIVLLNHCSNKNYSNHEKVTANFGNALQQAKGDYIFLSDQDDVWNENKVKICLDKLKYADFVVHQMKLIDCDNKIVNGNDSIYRNVIPKLWIENIIHEKLWGCCFCFNRKLLNNCLPFPDKLIGHDYWISTIAIMNFKCIILDDCLIDYRIHTDSVSYKKQTTLFYKINYRFMLLIQILKHILKK